MAEWLEYFVYAYTSGNICYEDAKEIKRKEKSDNFYKNCNEYYG